MFAPSADGGAGLRRRLRLDACGALGTWDGPFAPDDEKTTPCTSLFDALSRGEAGPRPQEELLRGIGWGFVPLSRAQSPKRSARMAY